MATIITFNANEIKERRDIWNYIMDCKKSMSRVNFNFAISCAYALGENVPNYKTENDNEIKVTTFAYAYSNATELANDVNMNKGTISKTLKAFKWIVESGKFDDFANGKYLFSFDKIAWLSDRERVFADNGYDFGDLMMDSLASLKIKYANLLKEGENKRLTKDTKAEKNNNSNNNNDDDDEILPLKDTDSIKVSFEGIEYSINVAEYREFLKVYGTVC